MIEPVELQENLESLLIEAAKFAQIAASSHYQRSDSHLTGSIAQIAIAQALIAAADALMRMRQTLDETARPAFVVVDGHSFNLHTIGGWDEEDDGGLTIFNSEGQDMYRLEPDQARLFKHALEDSIRFQAESAT